MTQLTLFDKLILPPTDPHVVEADSKRLSGQNAAILRRLRIGAASAAAWAAAWDAARDAARDAQRKQFATLIEEAFEEELNAAVGR